MNWTNVRLILVREIRDQLRDRRTLFMIAVLPLLLYPLLGMSILQVSQFMREEPISVLLVGEPNLEGVPALTRDDQFATELFADPSRGSLIKVHPADETALQGPGSEPADAKATTKQDDPLSAARTAMQQGKHEVVVYFPPDFRAELERFREQLKTRDDSVKETPKVPSPIVYYNRAKEKSQIAYGRVMDVLDRWTEAIGQQNLKDSQVPPSTARPFVLTTDDVAEAGQAKTAVWSKVLPFVLLIWAMTGAFYPAVDLCAGEKERGTLETLLCSPAERVDIVCGKLLTVMIFSVATAVLNMASMGITGSFALSQVPELGPPPLAAIGWLMVALIPMSALFSALCLALAALARSTKEGQYYLMPLVLLTMPLTVLPMTPGVELTVGTGIIPVTGVVLLLRQMLEGEYLAALPYVPLVTVVTLACVYGAIRWAAEQFNSESVLFRESERWDLNLWIKHLRRDRQDTPSVQQAVLCGMLILLVKFFMGFALPTEGLSLPVLAAVSQLVVVATPALLMTVMLTRSPQQTLLLRLPPLSAVPMALLLAVGIHPLADALSFVVRQLYPLNEKLAKQLAEMISPDANISLGLLLFTIAVLPAVCEEFAFRGFVLSGLRHTGHKWRAIIVSSIFFGLTHGLLQQSLVAGLVGVVIGYLAVQTGSILPGVLFHMVHNSLGVLRAFAPDEVTKLLRGYHILADGSGEGIGFTWPMLVLAAAITAAVLWWFKGLNYARTEEEALEERMQAESTAA